MINRNRDVRRQESTNDLNCPLNKTPKSYRIHEPLHHSVLPNSAPSTVINNKIPCSCARGRYTRTEDVGEQQLTSGEGRGESFQLDRGCERRRERQESRSLVCGPRSGFTHGPKAGLARLQSRGETERQAREALPKPGRQFPPSFLHLHTRSYTCVARCVSTRRTAYTWPISRARRA